MRALLCEGGPRLHGELIEAGLVDELFVTHAPKLSGGVGPGLVAGLAEQEREPGARLAARRGVDRRALRPLPDRRRGLTRSAVELVDYTDADLSLSIALETDPVVMAELGGPRPVESIERVHPRRVSPSADGGMWLNIVPGAGRRAGRLDRRLVVGVAGRGALGGRLDAAAPVPRAWARERGARDADRAPARRAPLRRSSTPSPGSPTCPRTASVASSASSSSAAARSSSPGGRWSSTTGSLRTEP